MFAGPRKSITQLFTGTVERELIGKEISHPTKAIATRAWAADQKTMDIGGNFDDDDIASNRNVEALQTELRHTHMSLLAERSRVQELESQLKSLMEKKYSSQSNIIDNLRSAQDKLREQLHLVIQSKMDLCESTALEIERLRIIIAELSQHLNGKINIESIMNKYKVTMNNNNNKYKQEEKEEKKYNNNNANDTFDSRSLEEQLNAPLLDAKPFPHSDISKIDIRTITDGDMETYPDPFAAVDLKYTGYKYLRDSNKWTKFTSTNISSTVFETRLGNHENIIGLEQAVLSMTKGEVARVWVPSRLGYGVHGAEPLIPPNTDLVFELTLVEIRNDFAIENQDENDDPLDPHQLAHIQQDDETNEDGQYGQGHSQLTTNNLNTLNNINNMSTDNDGMYNNGDNPTYNAQENELLGYDVDENFQQQNSFQIL
eukprot:862555_1